MKLLRKRLEQNWCMNRTVRTVVDVSQKIVETTGRAEIACFDMRTNHQLNELLLSCKFGQPLPKQTDECHCVHTIQKTLLLELVYWFPRLAAYLCYHLSLKKANTQYSTNGANSTKQYSRFWFRCRWRRGCWQQTSGRDSVSSVFEGFM